jgi:hypothetical protein
MGQKIPIWIKYTQTYREAVNNAFTRLDFIFLNCELCLYTVQVQKV